jgi:hypothetical protein
MPWCDDCAKFWNPASMPPDGTCPSCHRVLSESRGTSPVAARAPVAENPYKIDVKALAGDSAKTPWHFKLLVVAIVAYLVWRVVQIVIWIIN